MQKVKITWSEGKFTICDMWTINRYIALYGEPKFIYEIID